MLRRRQRSRVADRNKILKITIIVALSVLRISTLALLILLATQSIRLLENRLRALAFLELRLEIKFKVLCLISKGTYHRSAVVRLISAGGRLNGRRLKGSFAEHDRTAE